MEKGIVRRTILYFILVFIAFLLYNCSKESPNEPPKETFVSSDYQPSEIGSEWFYSGFLGFVKAETTSTIGNTKTTVFGYYDSTGTTKFFTEEFSISNNRVYWNSANKVAVSKRIWNPPQPYSPPSTTIGAGDTLTMIESWPDSNKTFKVFLSYKVEKIETLTLPAGTFKDCIKMDWQITYLDNMPANLQWPSTKAKMWFAKDVGLVKLDASAGAPGLISEIRYGKVRGKTYGTKP